MKQGKYAISDMVCPGCGKSFPIPRKKDRKRENGHIKDIYCPFCKTVQGMREYWWTQAHKNMAGDIL